MAANTVTVTIDRAGRLVLPKAMRDALHLKPGSSLEVERRDDELILRTPQPDAEIIYKNGIPVLRTRTPMVLSPVELIEQDREDRIQHLIRLSLGVESAEKEAE
jgi:AbrB family transcriptional regulator (stage V sporulation protein T)